MKKITLALAALTLTATAAHADKDIYQDLSYKNDMSQVEPAAGMGAGLAFQLRGSDEIANWRMEEGVARGSTAGAVPAYANTHRPFSN